MGLQKSLEKKHLEPYLIHELRINSDHSGRLIDNGGLLGIDIVKGIHVGGLKQDYWTSIIFIKPIFHPLSDLTKEIEHNGEWFIPADKLGSFVNAHEGEIMGSLEDAVSWVNLMIGNEEINNWPFALVEKLFEWHFDVFGLVEEGLAIDINTLDS